MKTMFKGVLLALILACVSAVPARATSVSASITITTGAGGSFIPYGLVATGWAAPVSYTAPTAGTVLGPGTVIYKIHLSVLNTVTTTASTFQLWDCPNGLTYASGAKVVIPSFQMASTALAVYQTMDFSSPAGYRTDDDGIKFKYYPIWIDSSTATINAVFQARPGYIKGTAGAAQ